MLSIRHPNASVGLADIALDGSVELEPDQARQVIEALRALPFLAGHVLVRYPAVGNGWITFNHQQEPKLCLTLPINLR